MRKLASVALVVGVLAQPALGGTYDLVIDENTVNITGSERSAITINGTVPGPLLRFKEGEEVVIKVTNRLAETSSIHWHGLLLPNEMDGVPGLTFDGIAPGETFAYRFTTRQSGTYWYHSHSGLQEQSGVYGPMIIDPAGKDPVKFDREHVIMLSDWTDEDPHAVMGNLKKRSGYYNFRKRTVGDFFEDASKGGIESAVRDRLEWGKMRMDPTDIADVTGSTYTYLVNGQSPAMNWTASFLPGERVRLRFINGSAMSYFDVSIPGLKMTVVQADGQNVRPVPVEEFRIAVAETYDVIVEPTEARAYTIFAESIDRSGYARATLAAAGGTTAAVPAMRTPPLLGMADMGMMHHGPTDHGAAAADSPAPPPTDHAALGHGATDRGGHGKVPSKPPIDHGQHGDSPGMKEMEMVAHAPEGHGPGNAMEPMMTYPRVGDPGVGLENAEHKVLVYTDLRSLTARLDNRKPEREIELHLTGNMERFFWGFDGRKHSEVDPIRLKHNERVRFTLANDTMMSHPIHLHGMFFELENGGGYLRPLKHTVDVKPAERVSFDITANEIGNWAFHCHLLFHMETGMFRAVVVEPPPKGS